MALADSPTHTEGVQTGVQNGLLEDNPTQLLYIERLYHAFSHACTFFNAHAVFRIITKVVGRVVLLVFL